MFFLHYEHNGVLFLIMLFILLIILLFFWLYNINQLFKRINNDVNLEFINSSKPVSKFYLYGKSYILILTGFAFSNGIIYLILKGVLITETFDRTIAGIVILLGILAFLYLPLAIYYIKLYFKSIKRKRILFIFQILSLIFGLYTTIKIFIFINSSTSFDKESFSKLMIDFIKTLLP